MDRNVTIDGKSCVLRSNALLPRKYRHFFNRDLISDMNKLRDKYRATDGAEFDAEVFENLTWLMLREAGEQVGNDPEEWLASIDDMLQVYSLLPVVVELWGASLQTTSTSKKK